MIKNILSLLTLTVVSAIGAPAQTTGSWQVVPMLGYSFDNVVETQGKVYYLSSGCLYSYDKTDHENTYYIPGEKLSSYGISKIYHNPEKKFVAVTYTDSNIDILSDGGKLVNVPDIRDANLTYTKQIRDVSFAPGRMYVATDFGFVVFDDTDFHVIESGIYNSPIDKMIQVGDNILAYISGKLYVSKVDERHKSFDSFEQWTAPTNILSWLPVDDSTLIYTYTGNAAKGVLDAATKTLTVSNLTAVPGINVNYPVQPKSDGFFISGPQGIFDATSALQCSYKALPADIRSQKFSTYSGLNQVWGVDATGVGCYDFSSDTPMVTTQKFKPAASQCFGAYYFQPSPDGTELYLANIAPTLRDYTIANGFGKESFMVIEKLNWATGEFTSMNPESTTKLAHSIRGFMVDPVDPSVMYIADRTYGLRVFRDGKQIGIINETNSTLDKDWQIWLFTMNIDPQGNLWLGDRGRTPHPHRFHILPKEKLATLRTDPSKIVTSDWTFLSNFPVVGDDDAYSYGLAFSTIKNPNKAINISDYYTAIYGIDTNGTVTESDNKYSAAPGFFTQDGVTVHPLNCMNVVEDKKGDFWIGTFEGVFVVKDVEQLGVSDQLAVVRPKVSRNDGTIYADYLLSTDNINYIAVDPNNRKWIATNASGLFLVNEDGTEILQNFTKDNSPLSTNQIWGVYCNPNGNEVFINTPAGSYIYNSTSSPAAQDFSEVIAYPNPVRPDYQGWITIEGLMENSLVKIADAQGSVVAQGRSEGGMYVWDGCNSAGERVRSGVYLVFASQSDGTASDGAVTKIVVIN